MGRKAEVQVAMVRDVKSPGKNYTVVSDAEILMLKVTGKVTFERAALDTSKVGKNYYVSYYVKG